eukprot:CAMPEP_0175607044 /NCGR_PEP_ID=MMETSP0096-20121207/61028_1 /TAXON_ID=311494 /ORGANISM="Alexandrium monilatum, Strain CCMP3105" /LENGTH=234 /DNA_ID=CAMNT_0016911893 /DNA_START=37 /DNA_END=738 /DNA_ORIENTATION=-
MASQGPVYRELMPAFALAEHTPPLPLSEVDEYGDVGFWSSGCLPFVHEGQTFVMAPDGMVIDPKTQQPVGIWNPETGDIVPFVIVQHGEHTYLMNQEGLLIDPTTKEAVGVWNAEKQEIEPLGGQRGDEGELLQINEPGGSDEGSEGGVADPAMARVNALEACKHVKMMDLEMECEILRCRAACWKELEEYSALLEDAERILSLDDQDSAARLWRSLASQALAGESASAPAGPG